MGQADSLTLKIQDSNLKQVWIRDSNLNPRKMPEIQDPDLVFKGPSYYKLAPCQLGSYLDSHAYKLTINYSMIPKNGKNSDVSQDMVS